MKVALLIVFALPLAGICCGQTKPLIICSPEIHSGLKVWVNGVDNIWYTHRGDCEDFPPAKPPANLVQKGQALGDQIETVVPAETNPQLSQMPYVPQLKDGTICIDGHANYVNCPQVEALPQYRCEPVKKMEPLGTSWLHGSGTVWDTASDCEQAKNRFAKEEPDPPKPDTKSEMVDAVLREHDEQIVLLWQSVRSLQAIIAGRLHTEPMTGLQPDKPICDKDHLAAAWGYEMCAHMDNGYRWIVNPHLVPNTTAEKMMPNWNPTERPYVKPLCIFDGKRGVCIPHCTDHIAYFGVHLWTGPDGNIKGATELDCEEQLKADGAR